MSSPMVKMLVPLLKQHLTDERVSEFYSDLMGQYPLPEGADKNVVVLSERDGRVYVTPAAVNANNAIVKCHAQYPLVELVEQFIKLI